MRKRSRIVFGLLLVAMIGSIAWLTLRPNEPTYEGKTLSVWLDDYHNAGPSRHGMKIRHEAAEAMRHMGTNAFPPLLKMLRAKDSPLTLRLVALAKKQPVFKFKFKVASRLRIEAMDGFEALGADGKDAVPELIRMYEQDSSPDSRTTIILVLCSIGPGGEQAVPALIRSLGDTNWETRWMIISVLRDIHSRPEIVVPALVKCLNDQASPIRQLAVQTIGGFGADAKPAVPDLIKSLNDTNENVRATAKYALEQIDPEAAAKAGVK